MFRLMKACFWLGLVVYFLPETAPAPRPDAAPAAPVAVTPSTATGGLAGAVAERTLAFCRDQPATCAEGLRLVGQALQGEPVAQPASAPPAGASVTDTADGPARDTLTPADLAVPFGGVAAPAGSAPRRAPLPPRRPV